ncbi:MAG: FtsW/RodA/SpoVE family cell cycle protein, partial [Candidatus Binatia bacterium]
ALFPVTGLPLPFLSYGGSSLVACMVAIGLLLNISMRRFTF